MAWFNIDYGIHYYEEVFALNAMITKIYVGDSMSYTSCSIGSCKKK
jgi:hypothetical protein